MREKEVFMYAYPVTSTLAGPAIAILFNLSSRPEYYGGKVDAILFVK